MRITIEQLERMKSKGMIKDYSIHPVAAAAAAKKSKTRNKTKEWIEKNLWYWAQAQKLEIIREHKFHPDRKWKFDWAFPSLMVAIEYEGLMSEKSRHTTINGYTGDAEKYNAAQQLGWKVLRYTAKSYKQIITDLNKLL